MTAGMRVPVLGDLHGMPFLDDEFASRRLLAIIAAVRHGAAARQGLAAALTRMYATVGGPGASSRISALTAYGQGCLELAQAASADLTEAGTTIAQRLKEAL
jgi:hypothetical protein